MNERKNKETVKRLLVESKEEGVPEDLVEREVDIEAKGGKANVITGIRRAGKTYRMFQEMEKIDEEKAYYINFEDERLINPGVEDLSSLIPTIRETFETEEPIHLFVDEIQNVEGWEKWARRIAERNDVYLYISGSSSRLSSREISTSLRGRTATTYLFPLSFREFLEFKGVDFDHEKIEYSKSKPNIRGHFNEYLKYGGFPEIVLEEDEKDKLKILREYFSTIVSRDLIERYSVGKVHTLEAFMKLLVNNFSRLVSFSKASNWLGSIGIKASKNTLAKYFDYMKKSYFAFDSTIYSKSVKDRLQYPRKVYLLDNGFSTALSERFDSDRGWFFENTVAVKLYREAVSDPGKEFHYWKGNGREVDFVLRRGSETKRLVQVCSTLEEDNRKREVKNLLAASRELDCENLIVVTDDYRDTEKVDGKKVKFRPLWLELIKPWEESDLTYL